MAWHGVHSHDILLNLKIHSWREFSSLLKIKKKNGRKKNGMHMESAKDVSIYLGGRI